MALSYTTLFFVCFSTLGISSYQENMEMAEQIYQTWYCVFSLPGSFSCARLSSHPRSSHALLTVIDTLETRL